MTDWSVITNHLLEHIHSAQPDKQAREMFKLAVLLREEPGLTRVQARLQGLQLELALPNLSDCVVIENEIRGHYAVGLAHYPERKSSIPLEDIVQLIYFYLQRLNEVTYAA